MMALADAWKRRFHRLQRCFPDCLTRTTLLLAPVVILPLVGCTEPQPGAGFHWFQSQPTPAVEAQPAATQPVAEATDTAASAPSEPTDDLTSQVEDYIRNLPLDDLQSKLTRHDQPLADPAPTEETMAAAPSAAQRQGPMPVAPVAPPPVAAVTPQADTTAPLEPTPAPADVQPASPAPAAEASAPVPAAQPSQVIEVEISPAVLATLPAQPPGTAEPVTNRPISAGPGGGASMADVQALLEHLRRTAAERPDSLGAALRLRMAEWVLAEDQAPTDWPLQDAQKRRLAESIWRVVEVIARADAAPQAVPDEAFGQALDDLVEAIQQAQPLQVPFAALCRSVSSYGYYEALPEPWRFPAGQSNMVVLYCELAGFVTEQTQGSPAWSRTRLGQRLSILTAAGQEIWSHEDPEVEDLCRRPRRDFFITKLLKLPDLPAGSYVLKATVRDLLGNRVTEANLPFEIVASM